MSCAAAGGHCVMSASLQVGTLWTTTYQALQQMPYLDTLLIHFWESMSSQEARHVADLSAKTFG